MIYYRVLHLLGVILLFLAGAMALASLWAFVDGSADRSAFGWSILITALSGLILARGFYDYRHEPVSLTQSFTLVALTWLFAGFFGALPFYFYHAFPSYLDAFFEAVSGFTTTGATLVGEIEALPRGILFWRSLTQWLGGMGIIVLFVAILPRFGFRNLTIFKAELPGPMAAERIVPRVVEAARFLWLIYLGLTLLQAVLLMLCGVSFYDSLSHALTTMPTGGFSTYDTSISGLNNPAAEVVIIFFMFFAGINFALYFRLLRRDMSILKNQELRFYIFMLFAATALLFINIYPNTVAGGWEGIRAAAFQAVSITTTTGYATADFDLWPHFSRALIFFLMFTGACGGSTGGSVKQARLLLMGKYAFRELRRMVHPSAVSSIKLGDKPVPEEMMRGVLGFGFLYVVFFVFSTLALAAMGLDFDTAASAVAASIGNVGPGLANVGPTLTYEAVPAIGRILLCLLMILGRLEIYTVLVLILPEARRFSARSVIK